MPLLDSFRVDHTIMDAPAVRVAKTMTTPKGDIITVFDLRFCKPNEDILSDVGIHTLEHLFAGYMREHLNSDEVEIIDISPMGCRTGFYMSLLGSPSEQVVAKAWEDSMKDIIKTDEIPEANVFQCGTCSMHSIEDAKSIAKDILDSKIGVLDNQKLYLSDEKLSELGN